VDIRRAVIAEEGNLIIKADYSGQELLILADLSGDENMLRLLDEGADLHSETARLMFGLSSDVDTKKHYVAPSVSARDAAKTINYGIAYGMTKYRLSKVLKCSLETAQSLIDAWFHAYPGVKQWLDNQKVLGEQTLQSRTICGWVRHFDPLPPEPLKPRYTSKEEWKAWNEKHREWEKLRGALHNKAMNTPIQGAGAGMIKLAVSLFFEWCTKNEKSVKITGIVHDEIVVEAPKDQAEEAGEMLVECMDQAAKHYLKRVRVPKSEVKIQKWWSK
jgi:DNA polymerase-1